MINLDKVKFVLDKRNINNILCNVAFGMDVSGSTRSLYRKRGNQPSVVQEVTDRIFAIAMSVDVDKLLDFYVFDDRAYQLSQVTESNVGNYIQQYVAENSKYWNGTNYAPVIKAICESINPAISAPHAPSVLERWFGAKPEPVKIDKNVPPVLAIIITDGENYDPQDTIKALEQSQALNVYWQLVGIGDARNFDFIKRMGDKYPNVGYTPIADISVVSEEDLYDALLNDEFAEWVRQFK